MGAALAFSRAQIAFTAALHAAFRRHGLAGIIDPGMGPILFALQEHGARPLSELAVIAGVPRSTMTGLADRLVRRRLVSKSSNPADGRGTLLSLSAKGRAVMPRLRKIEHQLDEVFRRALARETDAVAAQLDRVVDELRGAGI